MPQDAVKVFISYSHDSPEHERQVLALSERLRADGIDSWIDQYDPYPEEGWPRWMQRQIDEAEAVLLICTPTYRKRVEGKEEPGIGKGVCWEANLIYNRLYSNQQYTSQFVPVLFSGAGENDIPEVLRGQPFFRVQDEQGYESFYRRLTGQPRVTPSPLGSVHRLPKIEMVSGRAVESTPIVTVQTPSRQEVTDRGAEARDQTVAKNDIFISYKTEDKDRLRPLVDALETAGWSVFWDRKVPTGKRWRDYIFENLRASRYVIVAWSEKSISSDYVREEAEDARKRDVLLPIYIDQVEPPFGFGELQAHDLIGWNGATDQQPFQNLVRQVADVLSQKPVTNSSISSQEIKQGTSQLPPVASPSRDKARKFFISYPQGDPSDENLARFLHSGLTERGHEVFIDIGIRARTDWVRAIRDRIHWCDTLVVLLSERSMGSEMVHTEVRLAALQLGQTRRPKIIPVRLGYLGPLEYELEIYLGGLQHITWKSEADSRQVLTAIRNSVGSQEHTEPAAAGVPLPSRDEPAIEPGPDSGRPRAGRDPRAAILQDGPIRNDDPCYIERKQDRVILDLAELPEQTLVIKGPHQTGKSSLLLQYLSKAQSLGKRIAFVDFKIFSTGDLGHYDRFLTSFAQVMVRRLRLTVEIPEIDGQIQMVDFMEGQVRPALEGPTVFAFDEVDRVLGRPYQQDFFSMLRLWHENVSSPFYPDWADLDLALVISTEPYLLISAAERSPFTVGHRIETAPLDEQQCRELDRRYPDVLTAEQQTQLRQLLRGHPYLTRLAYYRLTAPDRIRFDQLIEQAALDNGPFGDHLRALRVRLGEHPELLEAFGQARRTGRIDNRELYYRLYGAGLVREEDGWINPANLLYARYFGNDL